MRITYLHQYFNTPQMSGSTRSYEMGRRLVKMGHEVNMITSWREVSNERKIFKTLESGINIHWIPVQYSNHMNFYQRIASFIKFAFLAYKVALSIKSDIVFASSTPLTIALPGVLSSRKMKVPFVFEVRDLWPDLPIAVGALKNSFLKIIAYRLENFAYQNSDSIVALSQGMKEGIIRTGYPSKNVVVIPNGSDLDKFNPKKKNKKNIRSKYGIPENDIVILYPGTFGKINGLEYLINLASRFINDKRIFFLTVGDGIEFEHVKKVAIQKGCLGKNLLMLDKVSKNEISHIFECSDIVISTVIPLPELEANSANKVFDGLAAGCCIAINHKGWQAELLDSRRCGFSLSQNIDIAKLELSKWLDNPEKIYNAGKNGRLVAESDFDRKILAQNLERLLVSTYEKQISILNKE